ncbi:hypothetical protein SELMODRAFT_431189 [Selaginella moellendorffii]|uniref:Uncharacterized protein n=1 Tax=Selaginella moellendorffii TaxID=88036 RepID=D8TBT8_SELML|nr:hypothetical protein SELMODRAFT_431189 [Selaginella moellendorffii]
MAVRSTYRHLLRVVKKHVSSEAHFKEFMAEEFRKNAALSPADAYDKLRLAKDYASLVASVHHHSDLLLSYNIAVDRSEEEKERLKDTAHRVGLQLPEVYKAASDDNHLIPVLRVSCL